MTFLTLFQKFHLEPLFELTKKWKSSYTKTLLTKNVPNDTSPCCKFFFRGRNPKNDQDRPKKPSFLTKNCGLSVFSLKIFKLTLLEIFFIFETKNIILIQYITLPHKRSLSEQTRSCYFSVDIKNI